MRKTIKTILEEEKAKYYRPLPECVTIKGSDIEGLGLFATCDIPKGTVLGVTHIRDDRFGGGYIRTPLGGFYNHSDNPNAETITTKEFRKIKTIKPISAGKEITVTYTLYNPSA